VRCNELPADRNSNLRRSLAFLELPAPLFTLEIHDVPRAAFHRFFDALEPAFSHMISLGQSNTIVSCPALTTHSELSEQALAEGGITPTTIRLAIGDESPYDLLDHFVAAARLTIDPLVPGFSAQFPDAATVRQIVESSYLDTHRRYVESLRRE
jgi:O-acetylhomoserine/O-acetylserine sulfhydrylase-like pyridoxal-dependent enzyme